MKLFAVSDLHLPGNQDKPMDVFGGNWAGHFDKIKEDWRARVGEEDAVLIAGDISWAMTLPDALTDLEKMKELPGQKNLYPRQSRLLVVGHYDAPPQCARRYFSFFAERRGAAGKLRHLRLARLGLPRVYRV